MQPGVLDAQRTPKAATAVETLRSIMIHEDVSVAAIAEESAAELSNIGGRLHPTRRFRIEASEHLQPSILLFGEKLDADGGRHIERAARMQPFLFPRLLTSPVVTHVPAFFRALRGAIIKDILARF